MNKNWNGTVEQILSTLLCGKMLICCTRGCKFEKSFQLQQIFTDRIRRMGKVMFSVCSHRRRTPARYRWEVSQGRYPPSQDRYPPAKVGTPCQVRTGGYLKVGIPQSGQDMGVPQCRYPPAKVGPPGIGQHMEYCYAAVGMPLAFTQDFLVVTEFKEFSDSHFR